MTVNEIAQKLIAFCKKDDFIGAQKELYSDDVISIEPEGSHGFDKETKGLKAVNKKIEEFMSSVEENYGNEVSEAVIGGNSFAISLAMDIKMKGQDRMTMKEICVYTVKDDKIILEQFYW